MSQAATLSRILTLVFTDLVASTALKARHGDHPAAELLSRHRALVQGLAAAHDGQIVDWAGDGCFLTFESASAAMHFALQLQAAHAEASELPGVRVGMHIGEVSEHAADGGTPQRRVEGLAVDLAARIAALARPAQVLVSAAVAESARQRVDNRLFRRAITWRNCGGYRLKGISGEVELHTVGLEGLGNLEPPARPDAMAQSPVRRWQASNARLVAAAMLVAALLLTVGAVLHRQRDAASPGPAPALANPTAPTADMTDTAGAFSERPAIAVLPFDNLSPDPEQAFFADGLAEDLITRLAAWRAFPVIARNSSFQYRGGNQDLKEVGRALGARYLVEGSVRRGGDRIRVTAQLIDAQRAEHVWAETYDRDVEDVFALQDEISEVVAASLVDDLTRAEGERARQRGTHDLQAWGLYQLGLQHFDRYTGEDFRAARELFTRATERDPRFATAFAYAAFAGCIEPFLMAPGAREAFVQPLVRDARMAVELDPRDPVAHLAVGCLHLALGDIAPSLEAMNRAIELNPSMPMAWIMLGFVFAVSGDAEGALMATERAQRLNPRADTVWIHDNFALAYWELGRHEDALEEARRLLAVQPGYFTGYIYLAMNHVALGRVDEAREAIVEGRRIRPDLSLALMQGYLCISRPAVDARRNAALRQAGLD
ncbi:MAG: adenylate/guanylate cyclase domain-containing protein [Gammaproteobacteria bacterium]